jgi:hypothetical protein
VSEARCKCGKNGYHRGKDPRCVVCKLVRPFPSQKPTAGTIIKRVRVQKWRTYGKPGPVTITRPVETQEERNG